MGAQILRKGMARQLGAHREIYPRAPSYHSAKTQSRPEDAPDREAERGRACNQEKQVREDDERQSQTISAAGRGPKTNGNFCRAAGRGPKTNGNFCRASGTTEACQRHPAYLENIHGYHGAGHQPTAHAHQTAHQGHSAVEGVDACPPSRQFDLT